MQQHLQLHGDAIVNRSRLEWLKSGKPAREGTRSKIGREASCGSIADENMCQL